MRGTRDCSVGRVRNHCIDADARAGRAVGLDLSDIERHAPSRPAEPLSELARSERKARLRQFAPPGLL